MSKDTHQASEDELEARIIEILDNYHERGEWHDYTMLEKKRHASYVTYLIRTEQKKLLAAVMERKANLVGMDVAIDMVMSGDTNALDASIEAVPVSEIKQIMEELDHNV